jgi:uncharacterized protein YbjQ (UPF0145 family)
MDGTVREKAYEVGANAVVGVDLDYVDLDYLELS